MDDLTDEQLMVVFRYGNVDAFDCLYMRYEARIYRLLVRMLKQAQSAEDALQEVFVKVANAASTYQPTGKFRTWIYRIAFNHALNELESSGRSARGKIIPLYARGAEDETDGRSPGLQLAARGQSPIEAAQDAEFMGSLMLALDDLPSQWRAVFLLVQVEGLEYAEAAEALDIPVGTVRSVLHRARARLAVRMSVFGTQEARVGS